MPDYTEQTDTTPTYSEQAVTIPTYTAETDRIFGSYGSTTYGDNLYGTTEHEAS